MVKPKKRDKKNEIRSLIEEALGAGSQVVQRATGVPVGAPPNPAAHLGALGGLPAVPLSAVPRAEKPDVAKMMNQRGITGASQDENALRDWIIAKESSGKTTAKNPNSSAFGLGQLIKANREAYGKRLGISPDTTDYNEQLKLMDAYVKERYGSYAKAKKFWEEHNWY